MSERPPQQPNGEQDPASGESGVNSYGSDDRQRQAEIEAARAAAAEERKANREKLERYVALGLNEEDAAAVIEHEDLLAARRGSAETGNPKEGEASGEAGEQEGKPAPRIYVRSLVDYNEGHDIGDWVDASQDLDDIHADVQAILARSLHARWTGEPSEEWAIHDQDGFGSVRLGEYESLDVVCALGKGIAEHGLAFAAWAEMSAELDVHMLERFSEAYLGAFESRVAFAEQVVQEAGLQKDIDRLVPKDLVGFIRIDYQAIAHEMEINGEVWFADSPSGVWVFNGQL